MHLSIGHSSHTGSKTFGTLVSQSARREENRSSLHGAAQKIDPAPIPRILGHAHHTVTVRKLSLCNEQPTA